MSDPQSQTPNTVDKRIIVRNTLANAGVKLLQVAAAFAYMPFLIQSFGLANYGVFLLASSLTVYLSLLDFGVNPTLVKHVAEYVGADRRRELARLVSNTLAFYVAIGVIAALLLLALARFGVHLLALDQAEAQLATHMFFVASAVALVLWPLGTGAAVLNGLQRYDLTAAVNLGVVLSNLALVTVVVIAGEGPLALFAGMGGVSVLAAASCCVMASRLLTSVRPSWRLLDRAGLKLILGFSWMLFVFQVAAVISDQQTDRLVLGAFAGAASVGLYEAASRLHLLTAHLASLTSSALMPAAAKLDAEARPEVVRALYLRGSKYTVALVTPVAVTLIVIAEPLLRAWLGPEIATMALPAQLLLVIYLLYANLSVAFPILIGTGRLRFITWYTVGTASANLALSLVLVGPYGVLGVVLGTVVADVLLFPLGVWYVLRTFGIRLAEYVRIVVFPAYPLLIVPALIGWAGMQTGLTATLPGVLAAIVVAVGSYWALTYATALTRHERDDVRATMTSVRARVSRVLRRGDA